MRRPICPALPVWCSRDTGQTVSLENIEVNRRLLAAYNARDLEAMLACLDPSIEFHSAFAAVEGAVYHGHDGVRSWHRDLTEAWGAEVRVEPEAYFDLGEQTLVFYVLHGRGARSGLEVTMETGYVVRWRDGRAAYLKIYPHRADALRDLGLSEVELEPIAP
jgi:ketosteroid isomerase-like protein